MPQKPLPCPFKAEQTPERYNEHSRPFNMVPSRFPPPPPTSPHLRALFLNLTRENQDAIFSTATVPDILAS